MKISFLGTGAAEGVPAIFCNCTYCTAIRKAGRAQFHTRSQVLINDDLSVDFPPEAYAHSLDFGVDLSAVENILVTHSHMDHFYAHDFILRGYKYSATPQKTLGIYADAEVLSVFRECTRREMRDEVLKNITLKELKPFTAHKIGKYKVLALPAFHGTVEDALLYYIEEDGKGYLHLYDTGALSGPAVDFLKENGAHANLIAFDCTFLDAPPRQPTRHMCVEDNMAILRYLKHMGVADGETKSVITHFSHNSNPTAERLKAIESEYGVIAAYDGMVVEI